MDCTAAAVLAHHVAPYLHPAQTVLNEFREPQPALHEIQAALGSDHPALVLSLDLSKAFERINPYWPLRILRIRGAPVWVVRYTEYILFGRQIRIKIKGRLMPPRRILTGVDMGRSFSVLLFCIGMDPVPSQESSPHKAILTTLRLLDQGRLLTGVFKPGKFCSSWKQRASKSTNIVVGKQWRSERIRFTNFC